jgi:hypothetical protein
MRAGLIPSRALQERRIIHDRTQSAKDGDDGKYKLKQIPLFAYPSDSGPVLDFTFMIHSLVYIIFVLRMIPY